MNNLEDFKIFALNGTTFLVSFSNIEMILKIALLVVSIGYTVSKWYEIHCRRKGK
jgi:hypothetical protein